MAAVQARDRSDTRTAILDVAEQLVQVRGYNGFSYSDISSQLGITNAALHYHFSGKAELGHALITRYTERFAASLLAIDEGAAAPWNRLGAYATLYQAVLAGDRMCLCGMLAAEYRTLPDLMREAVTAFFDANYAWLTQVLESGKADGTIRLEGRARDAAELIVGTLEGAMLVARTYGDMSRFKAVSEQLLAGFAGPRASS